MRVAEKVVAAVDVERAAHRLRQVRELVLAADERGDARGHLRIEPREHLVHPGRRVEHDALGPRLVVRRPGDGVLEQVRERTVPDVVEERRRERVARALLVTRCQNGSAAVDRAEPREQELHHERRADGVGEARVLRPGKRERRHAELPHAAQALHLGRVDEQLDDPLLVRLERHEAVHRDRAGS